MSLLQLFYLLFCCYFIIRRKILTEYFTIESQEGERIDRYLSEELEDKSRSYIQKLIRDGHVLVDGKTVKAGYLSLIHI